MKGLLLDENVPSSLTLPSALPVSHVLALSSQPTDTQIWQHAARHDLVIVTKDTDFSDRIMLSVPPPRVVHLRMGNMKLKALHVHLTSVWPLAEQLLATAKLVAIYLDRVEAIS